MYNNTSQRCFKITKPSTLFNNFSLPVVNAIKHAVVSCNSPSPVVIAKGDSAATGHFFRPEDTHVLVNMRKECGPLVTLPDNDVIGSSHTAQLPTLPSLSTQATKTAVLPQLASSSLVSLSQLCDDDCQCLLTKEKLEVIKDGKFVLENGAGTSVLQGVRNPHDRLWDIPIPQPLSTTKLPISNSHSLNQYHVNNITMDKLTSTINSFQQRDSHTNSSSSHF